jgi:hypothetical protein
MTDITDSIVIEKHTAVGKSELLLNQGVFWHMSTNWNTGKSMLYVKDREDNIMLFSTPWFIEQDLQFYTEITRRVINMFNAALRKETLDVQIQTSRPPGQKEVTQQVI